MKTYYEVSHGDEVLSFEELEEATARARRLFKM